MLKRPKWTLENGAMKVVPAHPGHFGVEPVFYENDEIGDVCLTPILAWLVSDQGYADDDGETGMVAVTPVTVEQKQTEFDVMFFDDGGEGYFYSPFDMRIGPKKQSAIDYLQGCHDAKLARKKKKQGAR